MAGRRSKVAGGFWNGLPYVKGCSSRPHPAGKVAAVSCRPGARASQGRSEHADHSVPASTRGHSVLGRGWSCLRVPRKPGGGAPRPEPLPGTAPYPRGTPPGQGAAQGGGDAEWPGGAAGLQSQGEAGRAGAAGDVPRAPGDPPGARAAQGRDGLVRHHRSPVRTRARRRAHARSGVRTLVVSLPHAVRRRRSSGRAVATLTRPRTTKATRWASSTARST